MRTLRLALAGMVTLTLLGGPSGVAAAWDEASVDYYTPVVGSRLTAVSDETGAHRFQKRGISYASGIYSHETWDWSDPRLPPQVTLVMGSADYRTGDEWPGHVVFAAALLTDPTGYWTGTAHSFVDEASVGHGMMILTGYGAYQGLFAVLMLRSDDLGCIECESYEGAIYEGVPPRWRYEGAMTRTPPLDLEPRHDLFGRVASLPEPTTG
jgi:hypothetical protein